MNEHQLRTAKKLREMGYRYNEVIGQGRTFVLRNVNSLLTGKKVIVDVAELDRDGSVTMLDAVSVTA